MNTSVQPVPVATENVAYPRSVERIVRGRPTSDGDGVHLTRVITQDLQQRLDPYLMLDAFRNEHADDYIGGFPDHPHRGFETVTYMIAGRMRHRDSAGHEGLLQNGGVQWMLAGSGLIHSELPEQEEGLMEGFQLWLNLPAASKMDAPWYRDIAAPTIPQFTTATGVRGQVIAGISHGVHGAVERPVTEPMYLDLYLPPRTTCDVKVPAAHNAFVYVYRGEATVGSTPVHDQQMAILANTADSDGVRLQAGTQETRVLLVSGMPLHEPIAQYGPFVMNAREQIDQTLHDYRQGKFEAAHIQQK